MVAAATPRPATSEAAPPDPAASPPPAPCPTSCKGNAPAPLVAILSEISQQDARGCYEKALRRDRSARGRMLVEMVVQPTGRICGVQVTSDELGDSELAECVKRVYTERNVPEPTGGCVWIRVPLNMTPRDADAGP